MITIIFSEALLFDNKEEDIDKFLMKTGEWKLIVEEDWDNEDADNDVLRNSMCTYISYDKKVVKAQSDPKLRLLQVFLSFYRRIGPIPQNMLVWNG